MTQVAAAPVQGIVWKSKGVKVCDIVNTETRGKKDTLTNNNNKSVQMQAVVETGQLLLERVLIVGTGR